MSESEKGDLGDDCAPGLSDTRMQERAIRERWPMSHEVRVRVLKRLCKIVDEDAVHEIGTPSHREVIAAARALISADKLNLDQIKVDHATKQDQPPEVADKTDPAAVERALKAANADTTDAPDP